VAKPKNKPAAAPGKKPAAAPGKKPEASAQDKQPDPAAPAARPDGRRVAAAARIIAWGAAFIVFWALNVRWGDDPSVGNGPPVQFQRQVVGAFLLALVGAGALTWSFFSGRNPGKVGRWMGAGAGGAVLLIAWWVRRDAMVDFPHLLAGPGWHWLLGGGGLLLSASTLAMATPLPKGKKVVTRGKTRRR